MGRVLRRISRRDDGPARVSDEVEDLQRRLVFAEDAERKRWAGQQDIEHEIWGRTSVMDATSPWLSTSDAADGPNMLSGEERRYLRWIASRVSGNGAVVELGPWLGQSTRCLVEGLGKSASLTTVDDFVWRSSWMDDYLARTRYRAPGNHETFLPLFREINEAILPRLEIVQARFSVSDGNEDVPEFVWPGKPIELLVVDCGRNQEVNETWFRMVRGGLVAGRTLIVMQDWRLFREVPFRWYNQTRQFTDAKGSEMKLLHEVSDGGLASFLFTG